MQIRIMTMDDYDALIALWSGEPGLGSTRRDDTRDGIERYLNRNPRTSFVAVDGGELIGSIMAGHDGRRGFIYHTCVAVNRRGEGIGAALAQAAEDALRGEGITKAALVAFTANETGNGFWERLGFAARVDLTYRDKVIGIEL